METRAHAPSFGLPVGRQGGEQLQLGLRRLLAEAELASRTGEAGEEQGAGFGGREAVETGLPAIKQGETAIAAGLGIDRARRRR